MNYGGSSGYGRAFRDRLKGTWGVVDVEDVSAAALHLVAAGRADAERVCIDGGSAGGYTTLACLAFTDVFKAGASLYGCVPDRARGRHFTPGVIHLLHSQRAGRGHGCLLRLLYFNPNVILRLRELPQPHVRHVQAAAEPELG